MLFYSYLYIYSWVVLPLGLCYAFMVIRQNLYVRSLPMTAITLPAILYPLGKWMQLAHIGPVFGKSYFSDIGFMSFAVSIPLLFPRRSGTRGSQIKLAVRWAHWAFAAAILVEMVQLAANANLRKKEGWGPRGDVFDFAIFGVTYLVVLYALVVLAGVADGWKWPFMRIRRVAQPPNLAIRWTTRRPNRSTRPPRERRSTQNRVRRRHGRR